MDRTKYEELTDSEFADLICGRGVGLVVSQAFKDRAAKFLEGMANAMADQQAQIAKLKEENKAFKQEQVDWLNVSWSSPKVIPMPSGTWKLVEDEEPHAEKKP